MRKCVHEVLVNCLFKLAQEKRGKVNWPFRHDHSCWQKKQTKLSKFCLRLFTNFECTRWNNLKTYILSRLFANLIYAAVLYMFDTLCYTEQKCKRYTTIFYILWESIGRKVFTKAKCFPDIKQAIRRYSTNLSLLMSKLCFRLCLKLYSLNYAIAHVQKILLRLSEFVILVLH